VTVTTFTYPPTSTAGVLKDPAMVVIVPSATEVSLLLHDKFAGALQAPKPKKAVIGTLTGAV